MERYVTIEERAINLAHYLIDSKDTVRGAAKKFGISKSTVHKDVSERLKKINPSLAKEVRAILAEKSRAGKTAEVKGLLTKFGVNKLSELDSSKYDELLKETEGI